MADRAAFSILQALVQVRYMLPCPEEVRLVFAEPARGLDRLRVRQPPRLKALNIAGHPGGQDIGGHRIGKSRVAHEEDGRHKR
jgi:hypothetical protein